MEENLVCNVEENMSRLGSDVRSAREELQKVYLELEQERCAAATAAKEAMAMITRLQEEKSSVLMEARQYRYACEERESHTQEAISLLKQVLLNKEDELISLQNHIRAYQRMLLRTDHMSSEQEQERSVSLNVEDQDNRDG